MSMYKSNPVMYAIYWAAFKKGYNLQEWATIIRRMYENRIDYPLREAVEIVEKYGLQGTQKNGN